MATINATASARFEAGGLFTITPQGGTALDVLNVAPGTVSFTPPFIASPIEYTDRSALQDPIEGEDKPGMLEVTLRCGKLAGTELFTALNARKTSPDGLVRKHTVVIKIPGARGGITGQSVTINSAYLKEAPQYKSGTDFDTVVLKFGINDLTTATY
jgi:hypothetical protein